MAIKGAYCPLPKEMGDEGPIVELYVEGRCGPDCIAEAPMLDTADGREHDDCPEYDPVQELREADETRKMHYCSDC